MSVCLVTGGDFCVCLFTKHQSKHERDLLLVVSSIFVSFFLLVHIVGAVRFAADIYCSVLVVIVKKKANQGGRGGGVT